MFTTDPNSLQAQLDAIHRYSRKWGLKINVAKTKICIFEKRKTLNRFVWSINTDAVEIVGSFCYLGIKFNYNGSFVNAVKTLKDQALKAYNHLVSIFGRVKLDVKTKLLLFDSMIAPILMYGCEVWGIYDMKEVDKLHLRFCKHILGVRSQTSNAAVLGELGRFPLSLLCKIRALKFWCKIKSSPTSLINNIYCEQVNDVSFVNCNAKDNWSKSVKNVLDSLGFSYVWFSDHIDQSCVVALRQRLYDQYVQHWTDTIHSQPKLDYYKQFKLNFEFD